MPTSTGWPCLVQLLDFLGGVAELFLFGAIHDVLQFIAAQRLVGGNLRDFELVDLVELGRFRVGRSGHAGQLFVHAEVVLEGDGGQRLVLALDLHAFLGFDGLMQTVATSGGPASGGR